MAAIWLKIKTAVLRLLAKLAPRLGKSFLRSLLGENKGEVVAYRYEKENRNILVFVHGFTGTAAGTFFKFPDIAMADDSLDGWDIVSIGYASDNMPTLKLGLWAVLPDITKIAGYLETNITNLLSHYDRVAFLAHSMGGLAVQKAILGLKPADLQRVSHVLFYGTPSGGLHKATKLRWYNNQIGDMDKDGPFIKELRKAWNDRFPREYPFRLVTVAGELDDFVPEESSLMPFDAAYRAHTTGNHIDMVKPADVYHPSYQILQHALFNRPQFLAIYRNRDLNNLIGNYAAIVHSLESQLADIDIRSFREYIFALEGYRDIDTAISQLENNPIVKSHTDMMGILGGRYKRKYLAGNRQADKDKAIELYQQAFDTANTRGDIEQIYYHAINLAFLYLYGNEDTDKMRYYATVAATKAEACPTDGYWRYATLAEAALYTGEFEKARSNYQTALQMAGDDKRSISSMYIQAHNACLALKRGDWATGIQKIFFGQ